MWKRKAQEQTAQEWYVDTTPVAVPASTPAYPSVSTPIIPASGPVSPSPSPATPLHYAQLGEDGPYYINLPPGLELPQTLGYAPGMPLSFPGAIPEVEAFFAQGSAELEANALALDEAEAEAQAKADGEPEPNHAFRHLVYWVLIALVWGALLFGALISYYSLTMPDPRATALMRVPPNIRIMAADGVFIAERGMRRDYVTHDRLPRHMVNAVISTEDRRFRYHFGFDLVGLFRAIVKNMQAGEVVQGGSTVTQQLAKNIFLEPRREWKRKVEELFIAVWLETKYSKDEIMELYLNRIYFGSGCYGVGAASYHYFGKKTEEITLAEAAFLTGLIKAPSALSSQDNQEAAQKRSALVLRNMRDDGFITEPEYEHALAHPAVIRQAQPTPPGFEYVVDWIVETVPSLTGKTEVNLTVETSLDMNLQRMADATVKRMMAENAIGLNVKQAALVLLAPDGEVKAMFGGMDYAKSQFNRAVKAKRQPASVFKAFVYLAALESGLRPNSLVDEAPLEGEGWAPSNGSAHKGGGLIPLTKALAKSSNTAAVRLMQHVGAEKVISAAHRLGLTSKLNVGPTLALGTAETTLLDITAAYTTFANGGNMVLPHIVTRVSDDENHALFERKRNDNRQVIAPENVAFMNEMLSAVVTYGTGRNALLPDRPMAGKTGTSSDYRDAWFIGYTADYIAGVWLGNDHETPMKRVTGGGLPAKIWRAVMEEAHMDLAPRPLPGMVAPDSPDAP